MIIDPDEEFRERVEALQTALVSVMQAGMEPASLRRLSRLMLESKLDVLRGALTDEPAAEVEPLRVILRLDASRDRRVRARPRSLSPENMEWLEALMQQSVIAGVV